MSTVAVIGAGFSGTLLALHLLRRAPPGTAIKLIERRTPFGLGQAYATPNPHHLLNVRAGNMSAFGDRPDDFLDWLNHAPHRWGLPMARSASFAPRHDFGAYIRALLDAELESGAPAGCALDLVAGEAIDLAWHGAGARLTLADRRVIEADLVVLATGNVPALPPPVMEGDDLYNSPLYRPDPWSPNALTELDPVAPVALIGTGLTAVDVVISLLDRHHAGPIHAISRRGLLPQPHAPSHPRQEAQQAYAATPLALLRQLRAEARAEAAAGVSWHKVVDGVRPFTSDIWQVMPAEHRARFLRHARPWWETHRHRMAPAIAERIGQARASGQFRPQAGRIRRYDLAEGRASIGFRPRGGEGLAHVTAARVINCSGPAADYARIPDTLIRCLLDRGLVRPDALRLGLDATSNCALRGEDGAVGRPLFAVGPLTRGVFWEMTAVPDIRRQCEVLAAHLAALLPRAPRTTPQPEPAFVI